jgi:hypothetical protein
MSIQQARRIRTAMTESQTKPSVAEKEPDYIPPPIDVPAQTWLKLDFVARNGARYKARVLFTVPTIEMTIEIGKVKTTLVGAGVHGAVDVNVMTSQLAYMIICFDEKTLPSWFHDASAREWGPYGQLYAEALAYETRYFRRDQAEDVPAASADDRGASDGRGADASPTDGVGEPVEPPAQRREVLTPDPEGAG